MSKKFFSAAVPLPRATNVTAAYRKGGKLSLFCKLNMPMGPSSSGKTIMLASTNGNNPLGASNAVLGLNVFCKKFEDIDLSPKVVAALSSPVHVATGLEWEVIDAQVLHLLLDIEAASKDTRMAKSGKSTLLISPGIKKVGNTNITIGMNCYIAVDKTLALDGLSEFATAAPTSQLPSNVTMKLIKDRVTMTFDLTKTAVDEQVSVVSLPVRDDIVISVYLKKFTEAAGLPSTNFEQAGGNVAIHGVNSNVVTLQFDLEDMGLSKSGKTVLLANTHGHQKVGNIRVSVVAYKQSEGKITDAVRAVLEKHPDASTWKVKSQALPAVMEELGLTEPTDELKDTITDIIKRVVTKRNREESVTTK